MANGQDNLIPMSERSKEEVRAIARRGGIKSGETRKKRKQMREQAELLLSLNITDEKAKAQLRALGIDEDSQDYQMGLIVAMLNSAMKGNVNAFNSIRELVGERVVEVNMNTNVDEKVRELEKYINERE